MKGRLLAFYRRDAGGDARSRQSCATFRSSRPLPDPIEAYLRPAGGLSNFVFFPWAGFVFAGAIVGSSSMGCGRVSRSAWRTWGSRSSAPAVTLAAYELSFRPTWYPQSHFWTTSPAFFFIRVGIMTAAIGLAYAWELRPGGASKWSPLQQLGRTSLFIYWIHVEMVYGVVSRPLHKRLSWELSWVALALFCLFMLWCSIYKDRVVGRWNGSGLSGSGLRQRSSSEVSEVLPEP